MKNLLLVIVGWFAVGTMVQAASFDCKKAGTVVEKIICGDAELSRLDDELSELYKQLLDQNSNKHEVSIRQRKWLTEVRNAHEDTEYLRHAYRDRIDKFSRMLEARNYGECQADQNHSMDQIIANDVMRTLRQHGANEHFWTDGKLIDFHLVPKGILFKPISGIYINIRPSKLYLLPELTENFHQGGISCPIGCKFVIKPRCKVLTQQGDAMLAFRNDFGELQYVPEKDFQLCEGHCSAPLGQ